MKRTSNSARAATTPPIEKSASQPPLLVFGAHPDDIEFGCGALIANEAHAGRAAHFVVCSRGEASTNGNPNQRTAEAKAAAAILGATIEFVELGGDAHFEVTVARTIALARIIRRIRPTIVLAPSLVDNQHPDHTKLGHMVRDATRLARFGGLHELRSLPSHAIAQLYYYAISPDAEPRDITPVLIDTSELAVVQRWTEAMQAHASQMKTRDYVELQLMRGRLLGLRAGVECAVAIFPSSPLLVQSLAQVGRGARHF